MRNPEGSAVVRRKGAVHLEPPDFEGTLEENPCRHGSDRGVPAFQRLVSIDKSENISRFLPRRRREAQSGKSCMRDGEMRRPVGNVGPFRRGLRRYLHHSGMDSFRRLISIDLYGKGHDFCNSDPRGGIPNRARSLVYERRGDAETRRKRGTFPSHPLQIRDSSDITSFLRLTSIDT